VLPFHPDADEGRIQPADHDAVNSHRKITLSRLLRMASRLPIDIIETIGPSPLIGRLRRAATGRAWARHAAGRSVNVVLESDDFLAVGSDARFEQVYRYLAKPAPNPGPRAADPAYKPRQLLSRAGRGIGTLYASP
jgi:ParB family chromosome partitioning protein